MNNKIDYGRSIGAVVGGYLVMSGLAAIATFLVSKSLSPSASTGQLQTVPTSYLVIKLLINAGTALIGGYVAAVIAGVYRFAHALILAGVILLLGAAVLVFAPRLFPGVVMDLTWFTYLSAVMTPSSVAIGGWLRSRKDPQS
ncbi:MAG: hypothetical protein JST84_00690 [Acidobacteria bacterium]|jgi:hypothetical protein|nr:hypothetical protein [Acidobacteriota bacterium]